MIACFSDDVEVYSSCCHDGLVEFSAYLPNAFRNSYGFAVLYIVLLARSVFDNSTGRKLRAADIHSLDWQEICEDVNDIIS